MSSSSSRGTSPKVYYSYTDRASSPFRRTNIIDKAYHKFAPYIPKVLGGVALITAGYLGHKYNSVKNAVNNTYQNVKQAISRSGNKTMSVNNTNTTSSVNNTNLPNYYNMTNGLNNTNMTNGLNNTVLTKSLNNTTAPIKTSSVPNQTSYR